MRRQNKGLRYTVWISNLHLCEQIFHGKMDRASGEKSTEGFLSEFVWIPSNLQYPLTNWIIPISIKHFPFSLVCKLLCFLEIWIIHSNVQRCISLSFFSPFRNASLALSDGNSMRFAGVSCFGNWTYSASKQIASYSHALPVLLFSFALRDSCFSDQQTILNNCLVTLDTSLISVTFDIWTRKKFFLGNVVRIGTHSTKWTKTQRFTIRISSHRK